MIASDQPTIFGGDVIVALSSVEDGNMLFKYDINNTTLSNRKSFLEAVGIDINDTTVLQLSFEGVANFARYEALTDNEKGEGMLASGSSSRFADALVVEKPGHALFLPVGDCAATVIYDPLHRVLMMSHLGRQSTEIYGARKSVEYLQSNYNSNPELLKIWIGPAVGKGSYRLYGLDNKGLHEAIIEQFLQAGVTKENMEVSTVDTATNPNYYSHSQSLKNPQMPEGRFAVVAAMRTQGGPAS